MGFFQSWFGIDGDELLAFKAPRTVIIRDRRLGLLYYFFQISIFVYIVIYNLWLENGYLLYATPVPAVKLVLLQPTQGNCSPNDNSCLDDVKGSDRAYCQSSKCMFLDGQQASPVLTGKSILISTYVTSFDQVRNPDCGLTSCPKIWNSTPVGDAFVADIESYMLSIDHSLTVPEFGDFTRLSSEMNGRLWVKGTGPIQQELCRRTVSAVSSLKTLTLTNAAPCYIEPDALGSGNVDRFKVSTLVAAMNYDLDKNYTLHHDKMDTMRRHGFSATIQIEYYNVLPSSPGMVPVSYYYKLNPNPAPYSTNLEQWVHIPDQRQTDQVRGIYFSVVTSGALGKFEFEALLITLTSSLTLLAGASLLVIYVMIYALAYKDYYSKLAIGWSPDFTDVESLEAHTEEQLQDRCEAAGLSTNGTKVDLILRLLRHHDLEKNTTSPRPRKSSPLLAGASEGEPLGY
jgi:hypothetical protein